LALKELRRMILNEEEARANNFAACARQPIKTARAARPMRRIETGKNGRRFGVPFRIQRG
jgi:hypothetical protein